MQRSAARRSRSARAVAPGRGGLAEEAEAVHRVLSELVRLLQLRDRDRICCHDISVTQCYALETLVTGGPRTVNELAAAMRLDKSTTSRVLDALVAKGYAVRKPHPEDGRALQVSATAAGQRLYRRIDGELLANVEAVLSRVDPAVRRVVPGLLAELVRANAPLLDGASCCGP